MQQRLQGQPGSHELYKVGCAYSLVSYITLGGRFDKDLAQRIAASTATSRRCEAVLSTRRCWARRCRLAAMPAVISSDHADESLNQSSSAAEAHRCIRPRGDRAAPLKGLVLVRRRRLRRGCDGIRRHAARRRRKLMSTDDAGIGAGPDASRSRSRGRNAHFPGHGPPLRRRRPAYLRDGHATKIKFPPHGALRCSDGRRVAVVVVLCTPCALLAPRRRRAVHRVDARAAAAQP